MRVLVTGCGGLLAGHIVQYFEKANKGDVLGVSRADYDLNSRIDVKKMLQFSPDVVIHCAAETDVDFCEREPIKAMAANRDTTANIVSLLNRASKFVYISTDMVYPDILGPHAEQDAGPINMYGKSKFAGESCARVNPHHLILRTNFFGSSKTPGRFSFSDWVIKSLTDGGTPLFFNDVFWTPLHMDTLSAWVAELVDRDLVGTYNLGSTTVMSKAAFAGAVAEHCGLLEQFNKAFIGPSSYLTRRPKDLSLDSSKIDPNKILPTLESEIKKL